MHRTFILGVAAVGAWLVAGCAGPAAEPAPVEPGSVQANPDAPLTDRPNVPGNDPR